MFERSVNVDERQTEWPVWALVAGFGATVVMTGALVIAYGIALLLGSNDPAASTLARWLWALAHNTLTTNAQTALPAAVLLHFIAGIAWAIVYAGLVEPRLSGPGWKRGLIFSPLPWLLSLIVFLPVVGGGFLGLGLGAGPLPIIGNLILHLIYGATLGALYAPEANRLLIGTDEVEADGEAPLLAHTERTMALGIIAGLVLGGLIGWLGAATFAANQGAMIGLLFGALAGSAAGLLVGSFTGLSPHRPA
jgi:hypothetical protein